MPPAERWRQHVARAQRGYQHPLSAAIRRYDADAFALEVLATTADRTDALRLEQEHIAKARAEGRPYNLSAGGEDDSLTGVAALAAKMRDPVWLMDYRQALSKGCKRSPRHRARWAALAQLAIAWRKANPKQAHRNGRRAIRIASKASVPRSATPLWTDAARAKLSAALRSYWTSAPPSVRKRKSIYMRRFATAQWAARDTAQRDAVAAKISESNRRFNAALAPEEKAVRDAQLAEARKNIDHAKRKANQKAALAAYWTPERRAAKAEQGRKNWRNQHGSSRPTTS